MHRTRLLAALLASMMLAACVRPDAPAVSAPRERGALYTVAGEGSPAVVFESGAGESRLTWSPVFLALAADTTVFAYDRPGSFSSPSVANPYAPDEDGLTSPVEAVAYLRGLLADARLAPPYLLVAHSLGGGYVLKFAQLYPDEVAGLVMVDARVPTVEATCLARLSDHPELCAPTPSAALEAALAYVRAEIAGMAAWELSGPAAEDLGDIPITVITATVPPTPPPGQLGPDAIPAEARVRDAEAFWAAQRDYAKAAGGRTVEAEGVGHYVHRERPQLVIDEVRALLERARERTR